MTVPKYDDLFNPLLQAIKELGGSASIAEIEDKVSSILNLSDSDVNKIHRGHTTLFSYRLSWARFYLKKYGLIDNSERGVWSLTKKGNQTDLIDKQIVKRTINSQYRTSGDSKAKEESEIENAEEWKEELLTILKSLDPVEFERLCQRILREAGFIKVQVTRQSGDGGIDGQGILQLNGFLNFRVIFQCKRYQGAVGSKIVREFRGTMSGRADKGLLITTSYFTRDAKNEADRDGSIPIDLIDGNELAEQMKKLNLGVKSELTVAVDEKWFSSFSK